MKGKGFCEDISEGKYSFPIIHCIQNDKLHRLENVLKQRTQDHDILKFAVECIKSTKSFEYTLETIMKIEKDARDEIKKLGGNVKLEKIMDHLQEVFKEEVK